MTSKAPTGSSINWDYVGVEFFNKYSFYREPLRYDKGTSKRGQQEIVRVLFSDCRAAMEMQVHGSITLQGSMLSECRCSLGARR